MQFYNLCNPLYKQQKNFLGTLLTPTKTVSTPNTPLTYSLGHQEEMQRQKLELDGDNGKHSQSQRNYEQNLAEMTPELWRVSDCEELVGGIHRFQYY